MTPLPRCRCLLAFLGATSCALPDHGGSWVEDKEPFHANTGGVSTGSGGNSDKEEATGGSLGFGGASNSSSSTAIGGAGGCAGASTGLGGANPCECATGGTTATGGTGAVAVTGATGGTLPVGTCAGLCQISPTATPSKMLVKLEAGMTFGYRLGYLPASAKVLSLGAVTANIDKGAPGQVQFGIYDDASGSPANLKDYTDVVTVGDGSAPAPVEGSLIGSFTTPSKSAFYWIFVVNESASSNVYIEALDTAQPQGALYARDQNCLPLLNGCPMATLSKYGQPNIALPSGYQIPYMYARYGQ